MKDKLGYQVPSSVNSELSVMCEITALKGGFFPIGLHMIGNSIK